LRAFRLKRLSIVPRKVKGSAVGGLSKVRDKGALILSRHSERFWPHPSKDGHDQGKQIHKKVKSETICAITSAIANAVHLGKGEKATPVWSGPRLGLNRKGKKKGEVVISRTRSGNTSRAFQVRGVLSKVVGAEKKKKKKKQIQRGSSVK